MILGKLVRKECSAAESGETFIDNKVYANFMACLAESLPFMLPENSAVSLPNYLHHKRNIAFLDKALQLLDKATSRSNLVDAYLFKVSNDRLWVVSDNACTAIGLKVVSD